MDKSNTKMYIDVIGNNIYENPKGYFHKLDGPAIKYTNGDKLWYKEGKLHKTDGPAMEWTNGDKEWYKEGQLHRLDGPAREHANGNKYWYILGKYLEEKEFNSWMNRIKICI